MDFVTVTGLVMFALVVGAYGTMIGAGGGFVLIPGLVILFDLTGVEAVGTGAIVLAAIGLAGARTYQQAGMVDVGAAVWFAAGAVPIGLTCAALLANRIDSSLFIRVLSVVLLVLAGLVLFGPQPRETGDTYARPPRRQALYIGGTGVGFVSGTFGVGGGLLTVPYLATVQRLDPHRATATTAATAMAISTAGAIGHTIAGNIVWAKALVLMIGAAIGSTLGARFAGRLRARTVQLLLATGLIGAGVPLFVQGV